MISQDQAKYYSSLHQDAMTISKELEHQEFLMIKILQTIDQEKVYRFLGFKSLFQYATFGLKLSPDRAYNFITVSRKACEVKKLQEALKNKQITLSKAKRISSVITNDSADRWLNAAKVLSQRSLEKRVAEVNPKTLVEEGTRFISETTLELRAAISTETEGALKRVQDLLCQSQGKSVSMDDVLKTLANEYLKANDPVHKAARILKNHYKNSSQRRVNLKHHINQRDQGQCQTENPDGSICKDSRWIDVHHIIPKFHGGSDTLENLTTLCKGHHQLWHYQLEHGLT